MLKCIPALKEPIWSGTKLAEKYGKGEKGKRIGESWEISVHPSGESYVGDTKLSEFLGGGKDFPILVKFIDAAQNLSVQVHPADEYARKHENDNGKTEMWYIAEADEGAGIYCGLSRDTSREEFARYLEAGKVEELLNFIPVKKGDCFLIEAGTVHAICAGCVICEIQQSSNVTYRVYDYNRLGDDGKPRELHTRKAADVIDFKKFTDHTHSGEFERVEGGQVRLLTECAYFRCRELRLDGEFDDRNDASFVGLVVIDGEGKANGIPFKRGDSFFARRGESYSLSGSATVILIDCPRS